jgi:hypothetical protein
MKCCFTTVVYDWYQDFIPIYIFSILKSFPQHYVKIFLLEKLSDNNKRSLESLKSLSDQFEVVDEFIDLDWCLIPHKAALRFLLTEEYFNDFKYVYFGDVDMLVYNQYDDEFIDRYVQHCEKTGLPFSNEYNFYENKHRITGLHFIIKEPYFKKMNQIIKEIRIPREMGSWWNNSFRSQCFHNQADPSFDEEMLYYMLSKTFDLRLINGHYRTNHGWHLGEYRYYYMNDYKSEYHHQQKYMLLANKSYQLMSEINDFNKISHMIDDELFVDLWNRMTGKAKQVVDIAITTFKRKML